MKLLSEFAVFFAVFGSLIMVFGAISYFGTHSQDQQLINPKFGIFAHRQFLVGLSFYLLSWIIKFIVYWLDPSIPMFGPAYMWYRMNRGQGYYYDDSFIN